MTVVKPQEDQDQDSAHISRTDSKKWNHFFLNFTARLEQDSLFSARQLSFFALSSQFFRPAGITYTAFYGGDDIRLGSVPFFRP